MPTLGAAMLQRRESNRWLWIAIVLVLVAGATALAFALGVV